MKGNWSKDMKTSIGAAAAAITLFASQAAHAQGAVQWKVSDGGNGHWYQKLGPYSSWQQAQADAVARGGHLMTITSQSEWNFAWANIPPQQYGGTVLGGYQLPGSAEPGQWAWVTGEPWPSFIDVSAFDDCPGGLSGSCGATCSQPNQQDYLMYGWFGGADPNQWFDDVGGDFNRDCGAIARYSVVEWSADCNNDGIVDFGQCRDGSVPDGNGNNVPDCCEQSVPCAPTQWTSAIGGNGHWYQVVRVAGGVNFTDATNLAAGRGGHLFTGCGAEFDAAVALTGALSPENWMSDQSSQWFGPWIGLRLSVTGWGWVDGSTCTFDRWDLSRGQPDWAQPGGESAGFLYSIGSGPSAVVHDVVPGRLTQSLLIEWSADCNGDGVVDYGQILDGTFPDSNSNGVPDCCEGGGSCCVGDILADRVINGADLGALLAYWGPVTTSPISRACDLNGDNVVNGADIGLLLSGWGNCP